jgi:serine/threonine protein kinase
VVERLGSFEIEGTLGEGGSAVVYAARDGERQIALKVLRDDVGLDAREVDRFLAEADIMRKVQHRALVPVLRAGMLPGGRPYIAMPRLRGKTLAERLAAGPMPLARAVALFEDVAGALAMLHDSGLVHRDVKPENVFWLEQEDRLVLLDLGIARDTSGLPSTTTRAGMMRGTPAYMAPERFFGKSASIRSDVYELALLLYAMLTGTLPWEEGDAKGRIEPKPPSAHGVQIPVMLTQTLLDALSLDIERRPPSVAALMTRVREASLIAHAPTVLSPFTPPRPQETHVRSYAPTPSTPPSAAYAGVPQQAHHASAPPPALYPSAAPPMHSASAPPPALYPSAAPPMHSASAPPPAPYPSAAPPGHYAHTPAGVVIASPVKQRSGGILLAVGAVIALAGAAGGALFVGALGKKEAPADAARAAVANDDPAAATVATATAVATVREAPLASASAEVSTPSADASASAVAASSSSSPPTPSAAGGKPTVTPIGPPSGLTPLPSATGVTVPIAPPGSLPPSCQSFLALMCNPASGSTPAECSAWKKNVQNWHTTMPPAQVESTCASAHQSSKEGLALRRASSPPTPPPQAPPP